MRIYNFGRSELRRHLQSLCCIEDCWVTFDLCDVTITPSSLDATTCGHVTSGRRWCHKVASRRAGTRRIAMVVERDVFAASQRQLCDVIVHIWRHPSRCVCVTQWCRWRQRLWRYHVVTSVSATFSDETTTGIHSVQFGVKQLGSAGGRAGGRLIEHVWLPFTEHWAYSAVSSIRPASGHVTLRAADVNNRRAVIGRE